MTSLTQVSIIARKAIRLGAYGIIFLILGKIGLDTGIKVYRHFYPKPPPAPTVTYGKLPKLPFPTKETPPNISYFLETPEGGLPKIASQAKVYFMPKISANLLSLDTTKLKANSLGFSTDSKQISQTIYQFPGKNVPSTLEFNIITGSFSIGYNLASDSSPIERKPPASEIASSQVRSFLSSADLLPKDLTGPTVHEFLKLDQGKLVSALSLSEANLIKINLFRKDFDKLPSLTSDPNVANVWFLVSGANDRQKQIVAGQYHYFPVDEDQSATYPIKTSDSAWEELRSGKVFIANMGVNNENGVTIRRVYLAYYDPGVPTDFYQPIFVFEGDRGFIGYVPAVTADYYGE